MKYLAARKERLTDLLVVGTFIGVAAALSLALRADIFVSVLLYLGLPSAYLCLKRKKNYRKIIFASATLGLLLGMAYDFLAEQGNAYVVNYHSAILNYHIIGKTPVGDFLWAFLIPFSVLVFYEHFLDDERIKRISARSIDALFAGVLFFVAGAVYVMLHPDAGSGGYAYLFVGACSVLPLIGLLFARHALVHKLVLISFFFFVLNLAFEITALMLGQWHFPGTYIGWITLFGLTFPYEEMLFWIIPSAAVFVFCYEMFFDDGR